MLDFGDSAPKFQGERNPLPPDLELIALGGMAAFRRRGEPPSSYRAPVVLGKRFGALYKAAEVDLPGLDDTSTDEREDPSGQAS